MVEILFISGQSKIIENPKLGKEQKSYFSHLQRQHKEVLKKWLKKKKGYRPVIEDDWGSKESLTSMRQEWRKKFHPYYAVGDFNRDGLEDFAVILTDTRQEDKGNFAIAIFNAPFQDNSEPNYFEKGYSGFHNCYITFNLNVKNRLFLGIDESDFYCVTFYPKNDKYFFKDCN